LLFGDRLRLTAANQNERARPDIADVAASPERWRKDGGGDEHYGKQWQHGGFLRFAA